MKSSKEESEKIRPNAVISVEAAVANLLADPIIKKKMDSLKVDASFLKKNLPLFLAYQESAHACNNCRGRKTCSCIPPFHSMDLFIDDSGVLNRRYGYCRLLYEEEATKNGYLFHDFEEDSFGLSLEKMKTKRLIEAAKFCSSAISNRNVHPWVYLYGDNGAGKSTFLIAFCNRLVKGGRKVAFLDCNKRFDEFRALSIHDKGQFENVLNQIATIEILVLDDFGNEYKSDYGRDQILMPLLNYRAKKNLVTYFSSDYSLDEVKTLYGASRASSVIAKKLVNLISSKIEKPYEIQRGFESFLDFYK